MRTTSLGTPLFDDIHDPVVGIMGVRALTAIQSLMWLAIPFRMCKTGNPDSSPYYLTIEHDPNTFTVKVLGSCSIVRQ